MKPTDLPPFLTKHPVTFAVTVFLSAVFLFTAFSNPVHAQGNQLSLADILIALRSKKATLPERNKILTDAVQTRGTTFTVTPEIEKELAGTGADKDLIESIRQKGQMMKVVAIVPPPTETKPSGTKPKEEPVASPAPPDFTFYEKRADASSSKGDFDAAMIDYTKAIELNSSDVMALLGRGSAYFNKNSYTLAIADYTKVIELDPKNSMAYSRRGEAREKKGDLDLATADYKKVLELDPTNETAKSAVARLEPPKPAPKTESAPVITPPAKTAPVIPEFLNLGQLSESSAIRLVKPIYPQIAYKANVGGKVEVAVELDVEGNVVSAKMISGNPFFKPNSEDAAKKSKFKPAMVGDQAVKAKGIIAYNFVPTR